jgi:putative membrane protein
MRKAMIGLALAAATISVTATSQEPMQPSGALQAVQSNEDKDFFETAASAGMFEIEAGKLAESRGTNPKIKDYGKQMIADHEKAADELEALAKKKGMTLPTQMLDRHQMMYDGLQKEKAGKDFDNEYRLKMIASHKEAVSLFDQAAKKSKDADVKAFAAKTLPKLQHHGGMANELPKS